MKQLFKKEAFKVTYNQEFLRVIEACGAIKRHGQNGTWITAEIKEAYLKLFHLGIVQSVEVWKGDELVGGLYGIYLKDKKMFCGESMFAKMSNASKYGFITYVNKLKEEGVTVVDCQIHTPHLASLGASEIPRKEFLEYLK